jgi:hypothetical protein
MMRYVVLILAFLVAHAAPSFAQCTLPQQLMNGFNADATLVMQNFNALLNCVNGATAPARVIKKQIFTSSGTYTPSANLLYAVIECVGGGGGGGGANSASTTQSYGGGGGGSGGYSRLVATAATIGVSQTVTIGAAGSGGAAGSNNGSAGGDTSVATLCVGKGGAGGNFSSIAQVPNGGAGGVAGTGDLVGAGNPGGSGANSQTNLFLTQSGFGASSFFGGGAHAIGATVGGTVAGVAAGNYGAGGSGGSVIDVVGTAAGGNGSAGVVFITEFCAS